jgi:hypothetical protein
MEKCFVCLENCKNRMCKRCMCFAHVKCWGKFINHSNNVLTYLTNNLIITVIPLSVPCPQCNHPILFTKSVTRLDTKISRKIYITTLYDDIFYMLENIQDLQEMDKKLKRIFNFLIKNKQIIKQYIDFRQEIQDKLLDLYTTFSWKPANLYHLRLFGTQII